MANIAELWDDVMAVVEAGAEQGMCSCQALHHVSDHPDYVPTVNQILDIASGVLQFSTPDAVEANLAHLVTAVIALGYALGAEDAYDITLMCDVSVPDDIAAMEFLDSYGERPGDE